MQQTENYKLNLIETSDPFSPNPLNENTQTLEAALTAETAARTAGDAALDARVTVLELKKLVAGSYVGNSKQTQFIDLGFTPKVVMIVGDNANRSVTALCATKEKNGTFNFNVNLKIVDGGFEVSDTNNANNNGYVFCYVAAA